MIVYPFHNLINLSTSRTDLTVYGGFFQVSAEPPEDPPPEPPAPYAGPEWYVSPSGSAAGDGSENNPWDIDTALTASSKVQPGHTVWLLGGRHYTLGIETTLAGTALSPITIKPVPGARAIIDGNRAGEAVKNVTVLNINQGGHLILDGFEVTNSDDSSRQIAETGSGPLTARGSGLSVGVPGVKLRNIVIHDVGTGLGAWLGATDFECYGLLIYNCGWDAPDRGHGHSIYTQNQTGTKPFRSSICWGAMGGYSVHAYTGDGSYIDGISLYNSVFYDGVLIGGGVDNHNALMSGNTFVSGVGLGYVANTVDAALSDNRFFTCLSLARPNDALAATGNRFYGRLTSALVITIASLDPADIQDYTFSENTYWKRQDGDSRIVAHDGVRYYTFAEWQASAGQDLDGAYYDRQPDATDDAVELEINAYDEDRALLKVFNFGNADNKTVDLSGFASAGEWVRIRSILDYFGDVQIVQYTGDPIAIDMRAESHAIAKPLGWDTELVTSTFPTYGVFVLEKYTPIKRARSAVPFIRRRRR